MVYTPPKQQRELSEASIRSKCSVRSYPHTPAQFQAFHNNRIKYVVYLSTDALHIFFCRLNSPPFLVLGLRKKLVGLLILYFPEYYEVCIICQPATRCKFVFLMMLLLFKEALRSKEALTAFSLVLHLAESSSRIMAQP
jgi:hypothetical protein